MASKEATKEVVAAEKKKDEPKPAEPAVSFRQLIRTADWLDWILMICGTVCAFATGAVQPWCVCGNLSPALYRGTISSTLQPPLQQDLLLSKLLPCVTPA